MPPLVFLLIPLLAVVWFGVSRIRVAARQAFWRGDYERALRLSILPGQREDDFRARALALGGRLPEAEKLFRKTVERETNPSRRATQLAQLADVLLEQGRYAETRQCLDEALGLDSGHGGPANEIASWYLRQGLDPQAALGFVDRALDAQKRVPPRISARLLPSRLINRAWALARLGRRAEAEAGIEQALRLETSLTVSASKAFLHLTAGNAYMALDEPARAREQFERAANVDPRGLYGKRARAALQSG